MIISEKPSFRRAVKKLHKNQRRDLEQAVKDIAENLYLGKEKSGDLSGIRVHKFKMVGQLTLLAYEYEAEEITLHLIQFGSHENFIAI